MRIHFKQWSEHGRVRLSIIAVAFVALLVAIVVPATTSTANHTSVPSISGVFESNDGNLDVDHTTGVDWNSFTNTTTATLWKFHQTTDTVGNPDSIYSGGVKQDRNCPPTKSGSLGSGSGKIDLNRIYLASQEIGGDDFLFVAWGRVDGSDAASSHVAYEFNRGTVACTNGNGLVNRIAGDVLIVYDFSGGDADAEFKVLRWITPADPGTTGLCEVSNNTPPCWGDKLELDGSNADGDVNSGSTVDDDIQGDTLGLVQFGEGSLNLSDIGIDPCDLTGTVTGVSRSSGDSGSAQMKDKVGPLPFQLDACVAENNITSVQTLNDTATINGWNSLGAGDGTGDVTFELFGPNDTDCEGTAVYTTTFTDITTSTLSTKTGGSNPGGYTVPNTTSTVGIYSWKITYTGDDKNTGDTSACEETADVQYNF